MPLRLKPFLAAFVAAMVVGAAGLYMEHIDLQRAIERQADEAATEIETMTSRISRDLTQNVGVLQGVSALMDAGTEASQEAFSSFVAPHLRENPSIRRIFVVRDGSVTRIAPFTTVRGVSERIEARVKAGDPQIERARARNVPAMLGPATFVDGRIGFFYVRPLFENSDPARSLRGFVGLSFEVDEAVLCPLGQCAPRPKYELALRAFVDQQPIDWRHGDQALFDGTGRRITASIRIPGVRFEVAGVPRAGWLTQAPERWLIRGLTLALALAVSLSAFLVFGGPRRRSGVSRSLATTAAIFVLVLGAGIAAVIDRWQSAGSLEAARDAAQAELGLLASRSTRDVTQQLAAVTNLAAFVTARPNMTDAEFRDFAQRLRRESPELLSIRLARGGKISHAEPADSIDPSLIGTDLTRGASEAAQNAAAIDSGIPVLAGPQRLPDGSEAFVYRKPVYLGDGSPARDRFWGFATVLIDRKVVLCKLGLCEQPQRFVTAVRLAANGEPRPAFAGDDAMFAAGSDAVQVSIRVPGARIDIAARPVDGWVTASSSRWILWAIALPAAFAAAGGLLMLFVNMRGPQLKIWIGVLLGLSGALLALFSGELTEAVAALGFGLERFVWPAKLTFLALAIAFTINAVLAAYVWETPEGGDDQMMRAPAILRSFVAVAIYGMALLWAAAFAFGLSLQGVGLTSGVVGIVIGIAVQRIILDFFSGVMIGIERPFAIGDWIEISNGSVRGMVTEMTWRTTTLRTAVPDYITVPNSVLAQAIVCNRSRPHRWTEASISVLVDMSVPFERVESVMLKVVEIAQRSVPNLRLEPRPSVAIGELKDAQVLYKLTFYVEFGDRSEATARNAIYKLLQRAFPIAGIEVGWSRSETRSVDPSDASEAPGESAEAAEAPAAA